MEDYEQLLLHNTIGVRVPLRPEDIPGTTNYACILYSFLIESCDYLSVSWVLYP